VEGDRERVQAFEGVVLRIRRGGVNSNFTVRRISHGVGVERTFPFYSPLLEKVDLIQVGRVRRAKLYYLRQRLGKKARIKVGDRSRREAWAAAAPVEAIEEEEEEEAEVAEEPAEAKVEGEEAEAEAPEAEEAEVAEEPAEAKVEGEETEAEAPETEEAVAEEESVEEEAETEAEGEKGEKTG
jgi:large subunit ribosomal protein L19